jgi:predicted ATPase
MLTRIEIDGFKSFEDFSLDLQPLTVVVGPNATGKSNLFDALRFLARLAETDLRSATKGLRGEPIELFRTLSDGHISNHISISVEVLLPSTITDAYGLQHKLIQNRVRYELKIERRREPNSNIERLFISREDARPIAYKLDRWLNGPRRPSPAFKRVFSKTRRKSPFLETIEKSSDERFFLARQDRTQGRGREFPALRAETTVLSGITSASEFPHLFALREELSSIRYLQLDPAAERLPSPFLSADDLEPNGANLAAVLARIRDETATPERPKGVLADILADLISIIPAIKDLAVDRDEGRREYVVSVTMTDGQVFSSRVLSDGTVRVLALLTLIHDPRRKGVICFEEPENGIHEHRLRQLINLIRNACVDPTKKMHPIDTHMLQVVVNTHSPVVMSCLLEHELVYADVATIIEPKKGVRRKTRMRPGISYGDGKQYSLTHYEIDQLLRKGVGEGA